MDDRWVLKEAIGMDKNDDYLGKTNSYTYHGELMSARKIEVSL